MRNNNQLIVTIQDADTPTTTSQFEELKFEDGGVYCGGTTRTKAHGHGVCTGPGGEGQYSGSWREGFEVSGSYVWPNGNVYQGLWQEGKMHGLGMIKRAKWTYHGELTAGYMGKYGVKTHQDSNSRYEGTWNGGVHCGFGVEVYSDNGTYVGQWLKGLRQGYGIRTSSFFQDAAPSASPGNLRRFSLSFARSEAELLVKEPAENAEPKTIIDFFPAVPTSHSDHNHHPLVVKKFAAVNRIGFFVKGDPYQTNDQKIEQKKNEMAKNKQEGEEEKPHSFEAFLSKMSLTPNQGDTLDLKSVPKKAVEVYSGEWKNDKRSGFGICERSDGLKYEGEWFENCKNGSGVTTHPDGRREEGIYKKNVLQEPSKKLQNMLRVGRQKETIQAAVTSSNKAAQIASQKAEIAVSRAKTAVLKKEQATQIAERATLDSKTAQYQLAAHIQQRTERAQRFVKKDQMEEGEEEEGGEGLERGLDRLNSSHINFNKPTKQLSRFSSRQNLAKSKQKEVFHGSLVGFKDAPVLPEARPLQQVAIYGEDGGRVNSTLNSPPSYQTITKLQNLNRQKEGLSTTPSTPLHTPQQYSSFRNQSMAHINHPSKTSNHPFHSLPPAKLNVQSTPDIRQDGPADKALQEKARMTCESLRQESRRIIELRKRRRSLCSCCRKHLLATIFVTTAIAAAATYYSLHHPEVLMWFTW